MKSDAENSDTQPIIVPDIVEAESPHPSPSTSSKKWAIIGGTLALTASLVYAFTGLLIKTFKLDFVDTLFVRSTLQTIFLFALIKVRKIPILLTFAEPEDQKYKIKKYCILIFQGICSGLLMMFSYLAILYCPLGDAMTVIYSGPLFTMLFSYLFQRIPQGLWKIFFALILLVGVILVIRPPFMFPNLPNSSIEGVRDAGQNQDHLYWVGIGMALAAACTCGLINVSRNALKDVNSCLLMFWAGLLSTLCSLACLSFDRNSRIFTGQPLDWTFVGQVLAFSSVSTLANWMATVSYQLIDPTICSVLSAQELIFAYTIQCVVMQEVPLYLSFIGAALVITSAICMPLQKYVVPKLPERLQWICSGSQPSGSEPSDLLDSDATDTTQSQNVMKAEPVSHVATNQELLTPPVGPPPILPSPVEPPPVEQPPALPPITKPPPATLPPATPPPATPPLATPPPATPPPTTPPPATPPLATPPPATPPPATPPPATPPPAISPPATPSPASPPPASPSPATPSPATPPPATSPPVTPPPVSHASAVKELLLTPPVWLPPVESPPIQQPPALPPPTRPPPRRPPPALPPPTLPDRPSSPFAPLARVRPRSSLGLSAATRTSSTSTPAPAPASSQRGAQRGVYTPVDFPPESPVPGPSNQASVSSRRYESSAGRAKRSLKSYTKTKQEEKKKEKK